MEKRQINSTDLGKPLAFKIVWEKCGISKKGNPMITVGLAFEDEKGNSLEPLVYYYLVGQDNCKFMVSDFVSNLDKDAFIEWDGDHWSGYQEGSTLMNAGGIASLKENEFNGKIYYKLDKMVEGIERSDPITLSKPTISDDDIPF